MTKHMILVLAAAVSLAGCIGQPQPISPQEQALIEQEEQQARQEAERAEQEEQRRQTVKGLNWILIGISTGKYSESLTTNVFKTYKECSEAAQDEANSCVPIAALPKEYWQ